MRITIFLVRNKKEETLHKESSQTIKVEHQINTKLSQQNIYTLIHNEVTQVIKYISSKEIETAVESLNKLYDVLLENDFRDVNYKSFLDDFAAVCGDIFMKYDVEKVEKIHSVPEAIKEIVFGSSYRIDNEALLEIKGRQVQLLKELYVESKEKWGDLYPKELSSYATEVESFYNSDEALDYRYEVLDIYKALYEEDASKYKTDYMNALSFLIFSLEHPLCLPQLREEEVLYRKEQLRFLGG